MALKYFFQSYLEGLLEKRKWQLNYNMMQRTQFTVKMLAGMVGRAGLGWAGVHRCAMCGLELL